MKMITMAFMLLLVGCDSGNNGASDSNTAVQFNLENLQVSDFESPANLHVGNVSSSVREVSQKIILKNTGETAQSLIISVEDDPGFKIKLNRCESVLEAGSSCKLIVSFSSRGLFNGSFSGALNITESSIISLSASISGIPDPDSTGTANLSLSFNSSFLPKTSTPYRELNLENTGNGTAKSVVVSIPEGYSLRLNRCPSDLRPEQKCYMQILQGDHRTSLPSEGEFIVHVDSDPYKQINIEGVVSTPPPLFDPNALVFVINTEIGLPSKTMQLGQIVSSGGFTVEWGDGLSNSYPSGSSSFPVHVYAEPGIYYVQLKGTANSINPTLGAVNTKRTSFKIIEVASFGNFINSNFSSLLHGTTNLTKVPSTLPPSVTLLANMFQGSSYNGTHISNWNTSNVTTMANMFDTSQFNQPLNWDTSNVHTMTEMFSWNQVFNQPLNWNTSKVIRMTSMFNQAIAFNQPLNWDVSKVTQMASMFANAHAFNQNLSGWCVPTLISKPTNFDLNTYAWTTQPKPVWGTCPNP